MVCGLTIRPQDLIQGKVLRDVPYTCKCYSQLSLLLAGNTQGVSPPGVPVLWEKILNRFLVVKYQTLPCKAMLSTQCFCPRSYMIIIFINVIPGDLSTGLLFESATLVSSRIGRNVYTWHSDVNGSQTNLGTGKEEREGGSGHGMPPHTCVVCLWQHKWPSTDPAGWFSPKGRVIENQRGIQGL